jgi:hypothetical protein
MADFDKAFGLSDNAASGLQGVTQSLVDAKESFCAELNKRDVINPQEIIDKIKMSWEDFKELAKGC